MATHNNTTTQLTPKQQADVLYWPTDAKIPIIPCNSKTKSFGSEWKNGIDFSKVDWNAKLTAGDYDNGIALVLGKTLSSGQPVSRQHPELYSFALDFDGWDTVQEFFGEWNNVLQL